MELERRVNVGEQCLDLESSRLEPAGQLQRLAEHVGRLVDRESGTIGRDLEKHSSRLAEVDGFEVTTIQLWRDVEAERGEIAAYPHLLGIVGGAKCNVVDSPRTHHAWPDAGNAA